MIPQEVEGKTELQLEGYEPAFYIKRRLTYEVTANIKILLRRLPLLEAYTFNTRLLQAPKPTPLSDHHSVTDPAPRTPATDRPVVQESLERSFGSKDQISSVRSL